MRMQRFMVVLFGPKVEHPQGGGSTKKIVYAMSPEHAMQTALEVEDPSQIKYAGQVDGIPFYEYDGEEHIVYNLPTGNGR